MLLVHHSIADDRLKAVTVTVTAIVTASLLTFFPVLVTLVVRDSVRVRCYQLNLSTSDGENPLVSEVLMWLA
jgi:hypothetical protein